MADRFTLGIEEEFQLVDAQTGALCTYVPSVLKRGNLYFGEKIKPEMLQPTVEFISDVLPDIAAARTELCTARALLSRLANEEGLALVSAGTHPSALWWNQPRTDHIRYQELEEEYQDVGRSVLIFGLHVHVGVPGREARIQIINQARTWLPHLLALSSNSPFWYGRMTGLKSYRAVVWKRFPRSGMPEIIPSWSHFEAYVQDLVELGCIDNGKKIWWDIRPHVLFDTVEFRIFDMPATIEDTLGIAALCQALVAKLVWLYERGESKPVIKRDYIEENKWRAMRYGLDAEVVDYERRCPVSMRDALREVLDFVDDVVDDLGSRHEIGYIRALLDDPRGTGADRQIAAYFENRGDIQKVQQYLIEQTMLGVAPSEDEVSAQLLSYRVRQQQISQASQLL